VAHLEILHGVVVVLQEDDGVGGGQVQAQPAHVRRQQHHVDRRVRVEPLNLRDTVVPGSGAIVAPDGQLYMGPWGCARRRLPPRGVTMCEHGHSHTVCSLSIASAAPRPKCKLPQSAAGPQFMLALGQKRTTPKRCVASTLPSRRRKLTPAGLSTSRSTRSSSPLSCANTKTR